MLFVKVTFIFALRQKTKKKGKLIYSLILWLPFFLFYRPDRYLFLFFYVTVTHFCCFHFFKKTRLCLYNEKTSPSKLFHLPKFVIVKKLQYLQTSFQYEKFVRSYRFSQVLTESDRH